MGVLLRVLGIAGILFGLYLIISTATAHDHPSASNYAVGAVFIVFGAMRFMRGMSR